MAYSKMPLAVQDYAVGFQSVNQARDNLDAVRSALQAEHWEGLGTNDSGQIIRRGAGIDYFGNHNSPDIPRAMLEVAVAGGTVVTALLRPAIPPVALSVVRQSTGVFFIQVTNLSRWYGVAYPKDNGTNPNFVIAEELTRELGATVVGIRCSCYSLVTGDFVLTDYPFGLAVYGTV